MRVKIGKRVYDSKDEPILVDLTVEEIGRVKGMKDWERRICSYPAEMADDAVRNWIAGIDDTVREETSIVL